MTDTKKSAKRTEDTESWTDAERDAMKERAKELKAQSRRSPEQERAEGEQELLGKIADMPEADRAIAQRLHEIVSATAPALTPRTYYGMPAWAKDGKVLCFYQPAAKFKARYGTFGFNDDALLDDGDQWATSWAIRKLTPAGERAIADLVKKAVG